MSTFTTTTTICKTFWPAFHGNINNITIENNAYRDVLTTTPNMQLVVMSLTPGQEIGSEVHLYATQFVRVESGEGVAYIEDRPYNLSNDMAIIIPPGTKHNIINTSTKDNLKLYTIYSPPQHGQDFVENYKE